VKTKTLEREARLERWWLELTPDQEDRLLDWVFDFGHYSTVCERRGIRQLWAWLTGTL
jgi:hypothetical protein